MPSLSIKSYGNLPQLATYDEAACVPTSFSNTLAAMSRSYPSLRGLVPRGYSALESLRNDLASHYFYTSTSWVPAGSPASLVVQGIQKFLADNDFAERMSIRAIGPGPKDTLADIANFNKSDVRISIDSPDSRQSISLTKHTPKFESLERQKLYSPGIVGIQDVKGALDDGNGLILGLMYSDNAGHAVSAVRLDWKDRNGDGLANKSERAKLTVIDPLNPSKAYKPSIGTKVDPRRLEKNPLIRATGSPKPTTINLVSNSDGGIEFSYLQKSVVANEQTQDLLTLSCGDSSNSTLSANKCKPSDLNAFGSVVFAGILAARQVKRDAIMGTNLNDVFEMDPGRNKIKGGDGSDLYIVGDSLSLQKGSSDIITDFKPDNKDIIGLRADQLGIDGIQLEHVDSRRELRIAARGMANLIYLNNGNYGILYSNQNGEQAGFGSGGGELIRLGGSPNLGSESIALL